MGGHTWLVPSLYAAGAIVAGFLLPRLEGRLLPGVTAGMTIARAFVDLEDRREASVEDQQGLGVPRARPAG